MKIKVIDYVHAKADRECRMAIKPALKYTATFGRVNRAVSKQAGRTVRDIETYDAFMIDRDGTFMTGLLWRVKRFLRRKKIKAEIENNIEKLKPGITEPSLDGIVFRPDQIKLIKKARIKSRGIIQAPTGTGKTIIAMGVVSMYPDANVLIMCHSKSIVKQFYDELVKYGFSATLQIGNAKTATPDKVRQSKIFCTTVQTYNNLDMPALCDHWDITIIDECHRGTAVGSQYYKAMALNLSPMRIGFTATVPKDRFKRLSMEGIIGPVIGRLTIHEARRLDILAEPRIKLIPVKPNRDIQSLFKYADIYEYGIVNNRSRNKLICDAVRDNIQSGLTTLVMVQQIEHGKQIQEIGRLMGLQIPFIQGSSDMDTREQVKKALEERELKACITTSVFREGINIKSLNSLVLAFGGKSDIATIQSIGRALRRTPDKKEALIVDFLDPYKFLSNHVVMRLQTYVNQGWIGGGIIE